jgi:hypothetical protein
MSVELPLLVNPGAVSARRTVGLVEDVRIAFSVIGNSFVNPTHQ